jgi:hypothetical protein
MHRAILLIALAIVPLAAARADDAAESRFFDDLGRRAYAHGHYEEALALFLDAQAAAPSASTLYNIALAAQLAHHDALAFSSFETFLEHGEDEDAHRLDDARARRDRLASTLALVHVTSAPSGAEIWVDRHELGSFGRTPRTLVLEPGAHAIELVLPDHEPTTLDVVAVVAQRAELDAAPTPHVGTVHVDVAEPGASVRLVHGSDERTIAAGADASVPVGAWTLHVSAPGRVEHVSEIAVSRDRAERRTVTLPRVAARAGRLVISTGEVRAQLSLDGVRRAETPARVDGVEVGAHHVTLEAGGFVVWEGDLDVRDGRATRLSVTLVPSP